MTREPLRRRKQLAARLDIAPPTVHRILRMARPNRLPYVDRAALGGPIDPG